ncbi:MAG: hypothetical protein ACLRQF_12730 [Thomasclavelia ramosa]
MKPMKFKRLDRVDYQVSIITIIIVCASFFVSIFLIIKSLTMIRYSLKERSNTIYHYVENYLDKDTFNHNFSLDMKNDTYKQINKN